MLYIYHFHGEPMKIINTFLNEKDYQTFQKKAEKRGVSIYALQKNLILEYLYNERQYEISITAFYWYLIYSLAVATLIFAL